MISQKVQIDISCQELKEEALVKGCWIAILHVTRIPPHIGLIFNGNYNSLTIKEREVNIGADLLLKTIRQKNIHSLFLKTAEHPVFSIDHQKEMFVEHLSKYESVKQFENSCLSPVKAFFNEFYALNSPVEELLFDFVKRLQENDFISFGRTLNIGFESGIELPHYSQDELNERIKQERQIYFK